MRSFLAVLLAATVSASALADNVASCEVLVIRIISDDALKGEAQLASYISAVDYIASVYDKDDGHITHVGDDPIRALMCQRNDVIPSKSDYALIATGIPFVLSQDFDSTETDSLTVFWKDETIQHVYKGYPLSNESQSILNTRLASFSKNGLNKAALETRAKAKVAAAAKLDTESEDTGEVVAEDEDILEPDAVHEIETRDDAETETDAQSNTETEAEIEE